MVESKRVYSENPFGVEEMLFKHLKKIMFQENSYIQKKKVLWCAKRKIKFKLIILLYLYFVFVIYDLIYLYLQET